MGPMDTSERSAATARRDFSWLLAAFVAFGSLFGIWAVLLPDLTAAADVSVGMLGAAISVGVLVSLPIMGVTGRLVDRHGARRIGGLAGVVLAASLGALAFAGTPATFSLVIVLLYASSGIFDVAVNASAIGLERDSGRRVLTLLHAGFSGGGMVGALATGIALGAGVDFRSIYPIGALFVGTVIVGWAVASRDIRRSSHDEEGAAPTRSLYREPLLLVLAGACALSFLSEGAMEAWSAIFIRDALGLSVLVGASGVAIFHGAMMVGRLGTAGVAGLIGRPRTLAVGGLAAAAGMVLVLGAGLPAIVLAGILVVGLGLSGVAPICFSLAGDASGGRAGQASW